MNVLSIAGKSGVGRLADTFDLRKLLVAGTAMMAIGFVGLAVGPRSLDLLAFLLVSLGFSFVVPLQGVIAGRYFGVRNSDACWASSILCSSWRRSRVR